jgi:hypothetical protein
MDRIGEVLFPALYYGFYDKLRLNIPEVLCDHYIILQDAVTEFLQHMQKLLKQYLHVKRQEKVHLAHFLVALLLWHNRKLILIFKTNFKTNFN